MKFSILGDLDADTFISEYWQQKPLLIRQALADFPASLTPEELAGLALEEEARARIVQQTQTEPPQWQCQHGPFIEDNFAQLPETHWTLLVQDVEKLKPELAVLTDYFLFLPRWRIDDLMVSYATVSGSVGPHVDQYDVFLLQGAGTRRWQIQQNNVQADKLQDNPDLQILEQFDADQEWLLEPGDMLYLPPGVAHYGIAEQACMTYSIGFRAPTHAEIMQTVAEVASLSPKHQRHYTDQLITTVNHPGELDEKTISRLEKSIMAIVDDKALLRQACGKLLSEPTEVLPESPETDLTCTSEFIKLLPSCNAVRIHPAVNMLYMTGETGLTWYVNGEGFEINDKQALPIKALVDRYQLSSQLIAGLCTDQKILSILFDVYQQGGLIFDACSTT